ncbi:predicted protein [Plenodomus lingam JN3]|uniref:Predicted protein n=1 Tax=Leptosphaeria maculans (strain JN3 / isolate v23.1.3 / race Av1-4-5-6-7-8) TaxID=985895 RepID=E4ZT45_LEPMJ|nr:predicted protein [Plenodomus lingam JN3]CBX94476.1 predicted protein [Plenodomus lingam JN3]
MPMSNSRAHPGQQPHTDTLQRWKALASNSAANITHMITPTTFQQASESPSQSMSTHTKSNNPQLHINQTT